MRVVGAQQEEYDWYTKQKLFGRRVLSPVVDLFPHIEVVVGATIELKGGAANPVKHKI